MRASFISPFHGMSGDYNLLQQILQRPQPFPAEKDSMMGE
jgi:hypothetical protein